jgi:hypothetical protein
MRPTNPKKASPRTPAAGDILGRPSCLRWLDKVRITPFLKKRSMSRVFDEVDDRWSVVVGGVGVVGGARVSDHWPLPRSRQRVGGAVKAGPSGPPGGGALRAPRFQLSPATLGPDRPLGGRGCGWLDTADLTIAQRLERGDRDARRPAIPSRRCSHGVFRPQSERAHSNRRPRHKGGHGVTRARVLAVFELAQAASRPRQRISPSRSP